MVSIYNIVTYHDKSKAEEAARAWISEGVCAINYGDINATNIKSKEKLKRQAKDWGMRDINKLWTFKQEIEKGDIILAYCHNSTVAAVGEVTGDYSYNTKNIVGREEDGFGYHHQRGVKWLDNPQFFDINQLPNMISKQLGIRGKAPHEINFEDVDSFLEFIKLIHSTNDGKFNEELVKAGLSKYIQKNLDKLETGLKITHEEKSIYKLKRPDFLAIDKNGTNVIIECKGSAEKEDIKQIKSYRLQSKAKAARYFLIASQISDECKKEALKNKIEVFEADLTFKKIA